MKPPILILLVFVCALFGCKNEDDNQILLKTECIPVNLQNGIIAYYPFNNGNLSDASSNGNDLINPTTASPGMDRNGNLNCAFEFKNTANTAEFLTTNNSGFLNGLSAFSIALWYQPQDTTRNGGDFEALVNRGDGSHCPDRRGEWSLGLYDCRRAVFGHNNSVWANRVAPGTWTCQREVNALTNNWHHVVAVYNNNSYKIYFNGALNESESGQANCTNLHQAQDIGDLFLGKFYTGLLDDVLIYNRELSSTEVANLWRLGDCCE